MLNYIKHTSVINSINIVYTEVGGGERGVSFEMSQCTLPILYFNLGGEMLYIIQQRLQAQGVQPEKAHRGKYAYQPIKQS